MNQLAVKCPRCKKSFHYFTSEFRPFCSDECRQVDLGHWLSETYAVPAQNLTLEEQDQLAQLVENPDEEN